MSIGALGLKEITANGEQIWWHTTTMCRGAMEWKGESPNMMPVDAPRFDSRVNRNEDVRIGTVWDVVRRREV